MPSYPDKVQDTRNDLFSAGLQNASLRYAVQKLKEDPENTDLMAFVGQTALEYERTKCEHGRVHWIDRLDVLHEGIDITYKCLQKDPKATQCERFFLLLALKAAELQFKSPELKPLGIMHNWRRIHDRAVTFLDKKFYPDVAMGLGAMNSRLARKWYTPYGLLQRFVYGIPPADELLQEAIDLHTKAMEADPTNMENVCRLASACLVKGDDAAARKWFLKVRDGMVQEKKMDLAWVMVANTELLTRFPANKKGIEKSHPFNLPFG